MMTAIIILAAGGSKRLGRPKQFLVYQGESFLRRSAETAIESDCGPVLVVVGFSAPEMIRELERLPVRIVVNSNWEQGMASSLKCGLDAISPEASSVLLMLCDQPHVYSGLLRQMNQKFKRGASIVACRYGDSVGVPALFGRVHFEELRELKGDRGARQVIERHRDRVETIGFDPAQIDIDTIDQYTRLVEEN